jgi:hypothetical protein
MMELLKGSRSDHSLKDCLRRPKNGLTLNMRRGGQDLCREWGVGGITKALKVEDRECGFKGIPRDTV